jgi:hypothetical protein
MVVADSTENGIRLADAYPINFITDRSDHL